MDSSTFQVELNLTAKLDFSDAELKVLTLDNEVKLEKIFSSDVSKGMIVLSPVSIDFL